MAKHNKKYQQVLKTGKDLFWKFGIKRVTIEEICTVADVSKMTFYKFFTNKTELVKHIIDHTFEEAMISYNKIMQADKIYKDKITDLVLLKLDATNDISHEFISDYYALMDKELAGYLQIKVQENIEIMLGDLKEAQKKGEIRKDIKPEFINYFLNHLAVMGNDPHLNSLYPDAQEMIMELMNFFFYGIMPQSD